MQNLGLVDRILLGRAFTIFMNVVTLAIVVPITWSEVSLLASRGELLHAFESQSAVGVLLVALGVILEGRHTFLLRVLKLYRLEHLPGQEEFCDLCELYGFYVLVVGLMAECFGELVKLYGMDQRAVLLLFCGVSVALNVASIVMLLQLSVKIGRLRLR